MSQSDYLRVKRARRELAALSSQTNTIDAGTYVTYKGYSVENSVRGTTPQWLQLVPADKYVVFDMERISSNYDTTACPAYEVCSGTDSRANRSATQLEMYAFGRYVDPDHVVVAATPCGPCCYDAVTLDSGSVQMDNVTRNATTCANRRLVAVQCAGSSTIC
jgi:hypothetical protein